MCGCNLASRPACRQRPAHQLRQLGDVRGDPPRFVTSEQLCRRSPAGFLLEIDIGEPPAAASFTMKQASVSSTVPRGGKRRTRAVLAGPFYLSRNSRRGSWAMLTATRRASSLVGACSRRAATAHHRNSVSELPFPSATTKHSSSCSIDQGGGKRRCGIYAERQWSGFFLSFKCLTRATNGAWP